MKIILTILLVFIVTSFSNCGTTPSPVMAVVICDISNSATRLQQNQQAYIDSMVSIVNLLPDKLPRGSQIMYIPVASNKYKNPFGGKFLEKQSVNAARAENVARTQRTFLDTVNNQLRRAAVNDWSSCLITSIENAYNIINSTRKTSYTDKYNNYRFQIIILSDMREYCGSYTFGKINMEEDGPSIIAANLAAIDQYKSNIVLSKQDIEIRAVMLTPGVDSKKSDLLLSYWKKILQKMDYDSSRVTFEPPSVIKSN